MKVLLAGHNIDRDTVESISTNLRKWHEQLDPAIFSGSGSDEIKQVADELRKELESIIEQDNLTPETLSAAYARISRNPAPINELRKIARDEISKARKSNESIIFGLGHSSVAEHAVFNIDVLGVSRYVIEEIEKFRLNAYTEKSQRYILLQDDYVIPDEIKNSQHADLFKRTIQLQNEMYHRLFEKLKPFMFEKYKDLAEDPKNRSRIEGLAKEDARYVVSMATEAQVGMTLNARNLELMLSRTASHELSEVREFSKNLFEQVSDIAPSVIKYTEATEYFKNARIDLKEAAQPLFKKYNPEYVTTEQDHPYSLQDVRIWQFTPHPHVIIAATLMYSSTGLPMQDCINTAMKMEPQDMFVLFKSCWWRMNSWDSVLREFENISILFELTLSAGCFGQMKRHRMTTQIMQPYDPELDVTVPDSVIQIGMEKEFRELIDKVNEAFYAIEKDTPLAAPYVLTNAHRRRMLINVNARELYHISRLREDEHAQWDIRNISNQMLELAQKAVPVIFEFACGKHDFDSLRDKMFA